ncbi:MAG: DUF2029 domain-containing protein [Chloroflexi bacterium]|nr:DUF2029 domain-containing protein [Chloroflexota bacterium]
MHTSGARGATPRQAIGPAWRLPPCLALALLLLLAVCLEAAAYAVWPVTFDLTQGADFSQEYLIQYGQAWDLFRPLLYQFEAWFPTAATSLEQLTTMFTLWWVLSFAVYLLAFLVVCQARASRLLVGLIVACAVVFQVTMMLMPGIVTTDLFSYAMYGYIARVYDLNPYLYVPGYFAGDQMTTWIHPVWYYSPAIYGPLWLDFSWWLTGFTANRSLVDQTLVYRLVAGVTNIANIGLLALLLRRMGSRWVGPGVLLYAWNPLLLFEFGASGHNDVLMMTFVLGAFVLLAYARHALAIAMLTLAALIKVTPVLILPVVALYWAKQRQTLHQRLLVIAASVAISLGTTLALYKPWYEGPQTFQLVSFWSTGPMYNNWLPDLAALTLADRVLDPGLEDQQKSWDTARTAFKWLSRVVFLVYFAWELLRLQTFRSTLVAASRVFLLFLLLVNTWVMPWYHTWGFMLAIPLGFRSWLTRVLLAITLTAPIAMYNRHYWSTSLPGWVLPLYIVPCLLPLLDPRVWARLRPRDEARHRAPEPRRADSPA